MNSHTAPLSFRKKLFPELLITHMGANCSKQHPGCFQPAAAPTSETITVPRLRMKISKGLFEKHLKMFEFWFLFYLLTTRTPNKTEILIND